MRIWTLHPKYLDSQGLVALWREALLARAVLQGGTIGYRHHPQLIRFQSSPVPITAINAYLSYVLKEADFRGFSFNHQKVQPVSTVTMMDSTTGQLDFEWQHLMRKLSARSPSLYRQWCDVTAPESNPLFTINPGAVESWERLNMPVAACWPASS
jgi:hypothetical protein